MIKCDRCRKQVSEKEASIFDVSLGIRNFLSGEKRRFANRSYTLCSDCRKKISGRLDHLQERVFTDIQENADAAQKQDFSADQ